MKLIKPSQLQSLIHIFPKKLIKRDGLNQMGICLASLFKTFFPVIVSVPHQSYNWEAPAPLGIQSLDCLSFIYMCMSQLSPTARGKYIIDPFESCKNVLFCCLLIQTKVAPLSFSPFKNKNHCRRENTEMMDNVFDNFYCICMHETRTEEKKRGQASENWIVSL